MKNSSNFNIEQLNLRNNQKNCFFLLVQLKNTVMLMSCFRMLIHHVIVYHVIDEHGCTKNGKLFSHQQVIYQTMKHEISKNYKMLRVKRYFLLTQILLFMYQTKSTDSTGSREVEFLFGTKRTFGILGIFANLPIFLIITNQCW